MKLFFMLLLAINFASCGSKKIPNGEAMANYPDMELILKENIEPYQKGVYMYQQIVTENGKTDTTILKAKDVNWKDIKQPFLEANIQKKECDRQYKIDFFDEEYTNSKTLLFTPIDPKLTTTKISVSIRNEDQAIKTLYAETNDVGFFGYKKYKLLMASGKTIQIQERNKKPFSKATFKITTLSFLN